MMIVVVSFIAVIAALFQFIVSIMKTAFIILLTALAVLIVYAVASYIWERHHVDG